MNNLMKSSTDLFPAVPSLIDEFFNRNWLDSALGTPRNGSPTLPAVNVIENNDEILIEVAAPGMKRDDFKVEVDNNLVTISSERNDTAEERKGDYTRREFNYQAFQRSFTLPSSEVKGDKIHAKYADGILRITIPRTEESKKKAARQISIS
jgi:HSP20 family protein